MNTLVKLSMMEAAKAYLLITSGSISEESGSIKKEMKSIYPLITQS